MEDFDFVKWWGAILATVAFGWNVYNSLSHAPKFKVKLRPNTHYPDGRVISTETTEYGQKIEQAAYCHIEITNVGKFPSTITDIQATSGKLISTSKRFISHSNEHIPVFMGPGHLWSCRLEMDDLHQMAKSGKPKIYITVSHKNKPIIVEPKAD